MIFKNQEQLDAALDKWQKILKLQSWNVNARIRRLWSRPDEHGSLGCCNYRLAKMNSTIDLLDPIDFLENDALNFGLRSDETLDHEEVLVHELLHLHFAPFAAENNTLENTTQEQAIDQLARALVALDRKNVHETIKGA